VDKGSCSPGKICKFPRCERKKHAKGLCQTHWIQQCKGRTLRPIRIRVENVGCKEEGCRGKHYARGYCSRHYAFLKNYIGFGAGTCAFKECDRPPITNQEHGLCHGHWSQQCKGRTLRPIRVRSVGCKEEGCGSKHHAHGYCSRHYALLKTHLGVVLGTCAFKGCDRPITNQKRGLCHGHSQQGAKGKQLVPLRFISRRLHETGIQKTTSERFDALVKKMPSGCWEWQGTRTPHGYGHFADGRVSRRHGEPAHRYSWARSQGIELKNLPRKLAIDHLCRNRSCVNPSISI